jgi:hypothetical protein
LAQLAAGMLAHELEAAKRQARLERRHVRLPARGVRRHRVQLPARLANQTLARQRAAIARAVHQLGQAMRGVGFPVEPGGKPHQRAEAILGERAVCAAARRGVGLGSAARRASSSF